MSTSSALSRVSSDDLKRLLRALHRGVLQSPITRSRLIEAAFGNVEGQLEGLVGLDVAAAKVVIAAVLAERAGERGAGATLAYMGVPAPGTRSRDMLEQTRELLATATKSIELVGMRLDEDARLLRTISSVLDGRDVRARLVFDARGAEDPVATVCAHVADNVRAKNRPEVYVSTGAALRARVVVVDQRRVLVTSAELSATEDDGSIDVGVLLDDVTYAKSLAEEWQRLIAHGAFSACPG